MKTASTHSTEPAFAVYISDDHFSVQAVLGHLSLGSAEGNPYTGHPGFWWLARLKIRDQYQGQGIGSKLLKQVFEALGRRGGFEGLLVSPGGYTSSIKRLQQFYGARGFVKQGSSEGSMMLWRPPNLPSIRGLHV